MVKKRTLQKRALRCPLLGFGEWQKKVPDIVVFREGIPFGFVQIKKYLTEEAIKEKELELFDEMHALWKAKALLLIYDHSPFEEELNDWKKERRWFDFIILDGENKILSEKLSTSLGAMRVQEMGKHALTARL